MLYVLRHIFDYIVVLAVLILLLVIGTIPAPGASLFINLLPAIAIYYWSLMRADFLFSSHVFLVGCLQDIISGAPIGLHAVIYLIVRMVAFNQYRIFLRRSFWLVWLAFSTLIAVLFIALAGIVQIRHHISLEALPISITATSAAFFLFLPLLAWLNTFLARTFWR